MPTHQPDILTDKKERSDFFIALFVILVTGVFITQTSLTNLFGADEANDTSQALASAAIVDSEEADADLTEISELTSSEKSIVKAVTPIDSDNKTIALPANINPRASQSSQVSVTSNSEIGSVRETPLKEIVEEVSTEVVTEIKKELIEAGDGIQQEVKEEMSEITEEVQDKIEESKDEVIATSKKLTSEEKVEALSSAIQESDKKECIIAVGLYRDQKNIKTLSNRLKQEGYDVFNKGIKSMTQIGVYISCDPIVSQSVLSEIREIYAKDAFLVK